MARYYLLALSHANHCKKVSVFGVFWSVFPRIWTEYRENFVSFRIQSQCGKIRARITPNKDTFHAVQVMQI